MSFCADLPERDMQRDLPVMVHTPKLSDSVALVDALKPRKEGQLYP